MPREGDGEASVFLSNLRNLITKSFFASKSFVISHLFLILTFQFEGFAKCTCTSPLHVTAPPFHRPFSEDGHNILDRSFEFGLNMAAAFISSCSPFCLSPSSNIIIHFNCVGLQRTPLSLHHSRYIAIMSHILNFCVSSYYMERMDLSESGSEIVTGEAEVVNGPFGKFPTFVLVETQPLTALQVNIGHITFHT